MKKHENDQDAEEAVELRLEGVDERLGASDVVEKRGRMMRRRWRLRNN